MCGLKVNRMELNLMLPKQLFKKKTSERNMSHASFVWMTYLAFYFVSLRRPFVPITVLYAGCVGTALDACHVRCFVRECLNLNHSEQDTFG